MDGLLLASTPASALIGVEINTSYSLQIAPCGYRMSFSGLIDEVAIFDKALTPTEVKYLYDLNTNGLGDCIDCMIHPDILVAWWPGNGNTIDIVSAKKYYRK